MHELHQKVEVFFLLKTERFLSVSDFIFLELGQKDIRFRSGSLTITDQGRLEGFLPERANRAKEGFRPADPDHLDPGNSYVPNKKGLPVFEFPEGSVLLQTGALVDQGPLAPGGEGLPDAGGRHGQDAFSHTEIDGKILFADDDFRIGELACADGKRCDAGKVRALFSDLRVSGKSQTDGLVEGENLPGRVDCVGRGSGNISGCRQKRREISGIGPDPKNACDNQQAG